MYNRARAFPIDRGCSCYYFVGEVLILKRDWKDLQYLLHGSEKQRQAYHVIKSLGVMDKLQPYDPFLVGTIPIGIDLEHSDLDIICCVKELSTFEMLLKK